MSVIVRVIFGAIIAAFIVLAISCEFSVWRECRADHSWLYCQRMMSGK